MLCWHHKFPEMNHNELVGWVEKMKISPVVTFHTSYDYGRTQNVTNSVNHFLPRYRRGNRYSGPKTAYANSFFIW